MERGQRSYGKRQMFVRAQSFANETGREAYVVYDVLERSYYAQTDADNVDGRDVVLIATVTPRKARPHRPRRVDPIAKMGGMELLAEAEREMRELRERMGQR